MAHAGTVGSVSAVTTVPISTVPLLGVLAVPLIFTAVTVPILVIYPFGLGELYGVYPRAEVIVAAAAVAILAGREVYFEAPSGISASVIKPLSLVKCEVLVGTLKSAAPLVILIVV